MKIESIIITRRPSYESGGAEFRAKVAVNGASQWDPTIQIDIPEEMLEPIVAIIQVAVAKSMTAAAERFHQEVQAALAGPAIQADAIEDQSN